MLKYEYHYYCCVEDNVMSTVRLLNLAAVSVSVSVLVSIVVSTSVTLLARVSVLSITVSS